MPGMTRREARIVELFEQGMSRRDIATTLGLSRKTTDGVISHLCFNLGPDRRFEKAMREGTRELEQRIAAMRAA